MVPVLIFAGIITGLLVGLVFGLGLGVKRSKDHRKANKEKE